jgi:predicted aldo/keto reductase-like oxidoreductase
MGCALSGMENEDMLMKNVAVANDTTPMSKDEWEKVGAAMQDLKKFSDLYCTGCNYCQPCPQGIDIPMVFLLDGYYIRYDLKDWARERYNGLPTKPDACVECGTCEEKCPYSLPIRRMLAESSVRLRE